MQFSADSMNTSAREQDEQVQASRSDILSRLTAQPIVMAISSQKHQLYYFEEVFRSQNKLIVDTVCKEFVFVLEMFDLKMS